MKKLLLISSVAVSLLANSANAKDGAYAGFDLNLSNAKNKFQDRTDHTNTDNGSKADHTSIGFGLNAGYKIAFDKVFVAPEVFFDYLNNSGRDTDYSYNMNSKKNDSVEINHRYGAKVNLGYDFNEKFSGFLNFGLANVDYDVNQSSANPSSHGASKLAPIYGLGLAYSINNDWSAKISVDRQSFNIQGVSEGARRKTTLHVAKVGLAYNF